MYDSVVPYIVIGSGSDPTAAHDITSVTGNVLAFSNPYQLFDAYYDVDNLATYEVDGIPTAVSAGMIAPPLGRVQSPPYVGVWSADISDGSGNLSFDLTVTLSTSHTTAFSMYFAKMDASGTIDLYIGGTLTETVPFSSSGGTFSSPAEKTFDKFIIHVTSITVPYAHVKIAEFEFGAMRTISNNDLTETINLIREVDLLESSIPIDEVDFALVNTEGKYDADKLDGTGHNRDLEEVAIGTPIALAFVFEEAGVKTVAVMGRYIIIKHDADEETLRITAQDPRTVLQSRIRPISLSTSTAIATTISAMLTEFTIPHVIDPSASSVMPDEDYTFTEDYCALDQLLFIQQRYNIFAVPENDGYIHIRSGLDTPTTKTLTQDWMLSYPKPSYTTTYNHISIVYGTSDNRQTYTKDLRTDLTQIVNTFTVDNPLVMTLTEAQTLATKIENALYIQKYSAEAVGDSDTVPRQTVNIEGRWSAGSPLAYRMQMVEYEYNGAFIMRMEGVR